MSLLSVDMDRPMGKLGSVGVAFMWLCCLFIQTDAHSQPFPIFNGAVSTCQGAFLDTGGQGASGYTNNENITYTICPDTPGGAISLNFVTANLSTAGTAPIDNITIFDGNSATAPQLGSWTGTTLQGQVVSASAGNPTGCLTIRFRSNNTGTGVFAATISCYQPCVRPTAVATHGANGALRICPGESVNFNSSASLAAPGFSIANRRWDFGDGTILDNAPETVSHTYAQPGGYTAQLYLLDNNGCASTNTVDLLVLVGTSPNFNGTTSAQTGCLGETLCLTGAVTGTTWTEPPAPSAGSGIFLPDEVGACFTSTISFDQFPQGAVLTTANGLQSICLNMEHSWMADLVISLISPTGQTVTLHQQGGGGTFLGVPVDNDFTPNVQGTCWTYCWSPTATNGTWEDNAGGTLPSGTYESLNSLNALLGSQLNGTWTIEICDLWESDNGFVCDWQLDFDPSLYGDMIEFTPSYGAACDSSFWSGPNIISTTGNCNEICVAPGAPGSYTYTYTVTDDLGCTYNTTSTVNMIPGPVVNAGLDAISCGTPVPLNASVTSGGFPTTCNYTLTLYDSFGDGWTGLFGGANGSNVTVTVNGVPSSWTLPNGSQGSISIPVNTGSTIAVNYTVAGVFNNEQSFTLFNSTGDVVYASPVGPGGGLAWSGVATCSGGNFIYSWTPAAGLNNPNIANPTATVATTTEYCVTAYQQGHPSCTSTDCMTITVDIGTVDPGTNGSITLCANGPVTDLFGLLGGTPQTGGTWTAPSGAAHGGLFAPSTDASGIYTYSVTSTGACGNTTASASVTVAVSPLSDAGIGGSLTFCASDGIQDLTSALTGTPNGGGTWTGPDGSLHNGSFSPASDAPGAYTYSVAGVAPCPSASSVLNISVNTPPEPGTDGNITLCTTDAASDLFTSLGESPQAGGTWTDPGGAASTGTFDPASGTPGVYTYTVAGVAPCPSESATVTVAVNTPPLPGTDGSITLCSTDAAANLFSSLGGSPQTGGTWTDPGGATSTGTFDPASGTPGAYTYTVAGTAPCPSESATVTVAVNTPPVPGTDGSITLCSTDAATDLFSSLGGSPQAGGTWTDPGGAASTGTLDPATGTPGLYTYTVAGIAPCPSESATVTVAVNTPPVPGTDSNITLCSSDAPNDLFTSLGGSPQAGGTWTDPGGAASTGTFDPASGTPGAYTYIVAGVAPCPSESATVTVAVNTPPVPGTDGSITLCSTDAATDLFSSLGGSPQAGGTWTDPGGAASTGTFDPATGTAGVYTYTVAGVAPCPSESATVTVAVNTPPVPGTDSNITLCSSDAPNDLFTSLGGSPQAGGTWTDPGGAASTGTFDPASGTPGVYTYTVTGVAPCPSESATVSVAVNTPPVPGTDGSITLCSTDAATDLFSSLGGTPQAGGTWTDPGGAAASGTFDPAAGAPGVYTYTVAVVAPCLSESATVTVAVNTPPVPGTDGSITLCSTDAAANLFSSLGGSPQAGGTWTDPGGAASTGTFDPASGTSGVYTYIVAGVAPCPSESATVTVAVNTPPVPGTDGNITLCSTDSPSDLFTSLGGSPQASGTWTDAGGAASSGTFDPASGTPGAYTYTVAGVAPCPSKSATVTVAVNTPAVPGTDSNITLCSSDAPYDLFTSLSGSPQAGGTWNDPVGAASTGTFDPASGTPGVYTYTVTGVAPCPSESATVSVAVNTPPVPGTDGSITLCSTDAATDLFSSLGGSPQAGGTWTDPGGAASTGTFDPATGTPGVYTYTVAGVAPCPSESAAVTVAVNTPPVPGTDGNITLCSSDAPNDLFTSLGGSPQSGGTWNDPVGAASTGTFDPASGTPGVYTYTVAGVAPCPSESATVTVAVNTPPVPGTDGGITLCSTDAAANLFSSLGGTPQAGGTWTDPGGAASTGTLDPATGTPGVYTYTVAGVAPCPSESAAVTVAVNAPPVPGTDSNITLCSSDAPNDLFTSLGGSQQAGGTWTDPGGAVSTGTFDPATGTPGAYTYTVAGDAPCPSESATVTVAVNTPPVPGTDGSITLCSTDAAANLFSSLSGSPQAGGTWTDPGGAASTGTFDPASGTPGAYTYTIAGVAPCPSESATVTVAVNTPPVPGTNGTIALCITSPPTPLFDVLGGSPDLVGTWTGPGGTPFSGSFEPGASTPGDYIYTVAGTTPCPSEQAIVTVSVVTEPDPGTNGTLTLCTTDATANLFASLGGTPDLGGTWTAPGGAAFSGTFDPSTDAAGVYTYTIAVPPPCVSLSSTVTVTTVQPSNAGNDGALTLCITSPATPLFNSLGGAPQAGGTWTAPGGGAFSGSFIPGTSAPGDYTYTVAGTTPCPAEQAIVTVSVVTEPDPGSNGAITLCTTDATANLFASLGGTPDLGGTWTAPGGGAFSGTFNPATDAAGVYTYTIAVPPPCLSVSSTVTVSTVQPPNAGLDGALTLCITSPATPLVNSLGGAPQAGGTWTGPGGAAFSGSFVPGTSTPGDFTYTVAGTTPCPAEQAIVTVSVVTEPDPGTEGTITLCTTDATTNLFTSLGGTPDLGGAWTAPGGGAFSGTFNPASDAAGVYTYTIAVPPPCTSVSSTVTISTVQPPNAGSDGATTLCISSPATTLFDVLGGTPNAGGTWTGPSGGAFSGSFIPGTSTPGDYTYTVAGTTPCPADQAIVTVSVVTEPDPGTNGTITLCTTDATANLFASLGGTPDLGGTWTTPGGGAFSGTFDPSTDAQGVYTYTIAVPPPCTSVSSIVTVNTVQLPNAGVDGATTLCISSPTTSLFDVLGGTPDAGGTWTDASGTTFSGSFVPGTSSPGDYTYTVAGTTPCPADQAVVSVSVVTEPDPGSNGTITLCTTDATANLFSSLGGTPDLGGTWTAPGGAAYSGTFDPSTDAAGVYTYTITVPPPCSSVSSTVTVNTVQPPNAGNDGALTLCITSPATPLFNSLGGAPQASGTWTAPGGGAFSGSFVPGTSAQGDYTYAVAGITPCPAQQAIVTVSVVTEPDPGSNGTLTLCTTDATANLFSNLGGTPDLGGTWTAPGGAAFSGTFNPNTDAAGIYTYTIDVPPPCSSLSSTVTVDLVQPPNAGSDGATTLCISSPTTPLFDVLVGAPTTGGTWTAPSGAAFSGSFVPGTSTPGDYTYTVAGTTPCPAEQAVVTVSVVTEPDPGNDGTLTLCTTDAATNLFASLGGTPDVGGIWTSPSGAAFSGIFDPNSDAAGVYTYTIDVPPPCSSVSSTVTVDLVQPPDAGSDGATTLCISSPTTLLFDVLGGAPNAGGTWTAPSGAAFSGSFVPGTSAPGDYTYTVAGTTPCPAEQAIVTVSVVTEPDPGTNGILTLCTTDATADLFASLGGTPDVGGTWTSPSGAAFSGIFDPSSDAAGVYTYTIDVPPPCSSVSSTVTVDIVQPPNAGSDGSTTLCITSPATPLFDVLGGTPEVGGTWNAPSGAAFSGSFVPGTSTPGDYTYTVAGTTPCPADQSIVSVSVVTEPDPGTNGTLSLCFSDAPAELFSSLGGTPDIGGTWTAPSGSAFTGTFDPNSDVVGVYTYTIDVPPPCSSVSSTVTVTTIQPPNAGIDAVIAQCITSGPLDLFAELGGTPDIGGTWTGPTGAVFNGPFIPGTSEPGQYTYTVAGNAPCPADQASATVTVVTEPDPGGDGFIELCSTDGPAQLFNSLEGDPDQGGAWTAPDGTAFSGTFDPATDAAGIYTYTIAVPPPCSSVSSMVTVQSVVPPNAGSDGEISLCISGGATDLFPILGGSPEQGGSWTDPAGVPFGGSFQPGADATGNYTYTVAGNAPCPAATAIVIVGTVNDVFAGNNAILNLCATGDPIDLFPSLSGADLNGTWTAPGGSAFTGTFVPGTDLPGAYTYTVLGTAPCTNDNAVITVNVLVDAYAGVDGATTLCGDNAPVDLFAVLSNGPNPGGNWIAPNGTATSGTFDPATNAPGTYTYVVAVPLPCLNDTAQVQVAVVAPVDAGLDASIARCSNDDAFDLFGQLGGTPQTGGVWSGPGGSSASTFTPGTSTPGNYTYTMLGTAPCPDQSAVITVSVSQAPYAGENGAITLCTTDASEVLFESLEGSPNTNGTWTAPGGQPFSGTFDPATDAAGTYTYTITVPPPCVSVSSTVLVSTVQPPIAGTDATLPLCASSPSTPLFPSLGAGAQNGGTWTAPGGGIFGGSFDPALHTAGGYTYTVEGVTPCPADAATISVTVEPLPDPGTNGSATVCPEAAPVQLFDLLGGTPQTGGTWTGPSGAPSNGVFDPASDPQGVYTYTVAAAAVCPDLSSSATVAIFIVSTPNAGPDAVTCDLDYTLNATGNWSTGVWSGPAGVTFADPTAANTTVTSTSGGPFTLTWTVVSTDGCGAEDSVTIIFTEAIVPVAKPTDAICYGACDGTASVTATGGNTDQNGYTYQWSAGSVGAGGSSVSGLCAGDYTVVVADMNGCTAEAPFTIGQPVPLVIDLLTATPETCPGSCDGTIVVVDPEGSQYSINGGAFQAEPRFGDLCPGTYTITMLDGNGCSASATDSVGTPAPVIAGFDFTPETLFVTSTLADFVNTSTTNAVNFSWAFAGIGTSTEASPSFTFPGGLGAEYTVCLTASDVNGCSDEYCRVVTILDVLVVYVPNTFTPDNDGINDDFVPIFNVPWVEDYEFLIFDRWGERIFESFTPGEAWDGSMRGDLVETEVYVWKLYCRDQLTNERISRIGHVTVLK